MLIDKCSPLEANYQFVVTRKKICEIKEGRMEINYFGEEMIYESE